MPTDFTAELCCICAVFRLVWTRSSRKIWGCCNDPQTLQHFPQKTFPNTNDCYSMKNQMSLKWSAWSHTFNQRPSPSPCQLFFWPFKPLSHNSCVSRRFPHQSSAANNARQTKGRRCVYLCSAHGWAVQMQLFIYNPPNFPVIAFLVFTQM